MKLSNFIQESFIYDLVKPQKGKDGVFQMTAIEFLSMLDANVYRLGGKTYIENDSICEEIEEDLTKLYVVFVNGEFEGAYTSRKKADNAYFIVSIIKEEENKNRG